MPVSPDEWPLTMTAMVQRFMTAGADFLVRLVAAVREKTPDIEDKELSLALTAATKKDQRSESLWLRTVPTCVENFRREQAKELVRWS
jgi:hypothetical protein